MIHAGSTITRTFQTRHNGSLVAPDSDPSVKVYRNGTLTSLSVTVLQLSIGTYSFEFLIPESWISGDDVEVHVSAEVDNRPIGNISNIGRVSSLSDFAIEVWNHEICP